MQQVHQYQKVNDCESRLMIYLKLAGKRFSDILTFLKTDQFFFLFFLRGDNYYFFFNLKAEWEGSREILDRRNIFIFRKLSTSSKHPRVDFIQKGKLIFGAHSKFNRLPIFGTRWLSLTGKGLRTDDHASSTRQSKFNGIKNY